MAESQDPHKKIPASINLIMVDGVLGFWGCIDVAAEIIKWIQKHFLMLMMLNCMKMARWLYCIQNTSLLMTNALTLDHKTFTCVTWLNGEWWLTAKRKSKNHGWLLLYPVKNSFISDDVDIEKVMDGLHVDHDGEHKLFKIHPEVEAAQN